MHPPSRISREITWSAETITKAIWRATGRGPNFYHQQRLESTTEDPTDELDVTDNGWMVKLEYDYDMGYWYGIDSDSDRLIERNKYGLMNKIQGYGADHEPLEIMSLARDSTLLLSSPGFWATPLDIFFSLFQEPMMMKFLVVQTQAPPLSWIKPNHTFFK